MFKSKKQFTGFVITNTARFYKKYKKLLESNKLKTSKKLSEKEQKIANAFSNGDWGCQKTSVATLVNAIVGKNICKECNDDDDYEEFLYKKGVAVVPFANESGHSLKLNEVYVIYLPFDSDKNDEVDFVINKTGKDIHSCSYQSNDTRIATNKEIKEFVKGLDLKTINKIFN